MILSDGEIDDLQHSLERHGRSLISPYDPAMLQPGSYDFRLGTSFKWLRDLPTTIDPRESQEDQYWGVEHDGAPGHCHGNQPFHLVSGGFVLATSVEWFNFPPNIIGMINGKSSLGRLALTVHITAGFFDAGFSGRATLELANMGPRTILLFPGMKIGQMVFIRMGRDAQRPYGSPELGSRYQDQQTTTASRGVREI